MLYTIHVCLFRQAVVGPRGERGGQGSSVTELLCDRTDRPHAHPTQMSATHEVDFPTTLPTGRVLPGTVVVSSARKEGTLVLLHGMASHKDHSFAPRLARHLCECFNYSVVRFTARSPAPDPHEPSHRYRICGFEDDKRDLETVLANAAAQYGPLKGVVGHSRGANVSLLYASSCPYPVPTVAIAPRFHMGNMVKGRMFKDEQREALLVRGEAIQWDTKMGTITVLPEDVPVLNALDMGAVVKSIQPRLKVTIIHGTGDSTIPATDATEGYREVSPVSCELKVVVVEGAKHNFDGKHEAALIAHVTDHFKSCHFGECKLACRGVVCACV